MKIVHSLCAALAIAGLSAAAGTAQANVTNKPIVLVNSAPRVENGSTHQSNNNTNHNNNESRNNNNHRVPEPSTILLLGSGLLALGAASRSRA